MKHVSFASLLFACLIVVGLSSPAAVYAQDKVSRKSVFTTGFIVGPVLTSASTYVYFNCCFRLNMGSPGMSIFLREHDRELIDELALGGGETFEQIARMMRVKPHVHSVARASIRSRRAALLRSLEAGEYQVFLSELNDAYSSSTDESVFTDAP